jgi:cell division protein FtsZ
VLHSGVRGVTDLMVMPGLINLDFADIRTVMSEMGKAMMGTGEAEGDGRAISAAEAAISNPLLDDVSMRGARGVLINITGGMDMTLFEVDEAANRIREEVDPEANIIFGSTFDESMNGVMRVSIVATGIDAEEGERPVPLSVMADKAKIRSVPQPVEEVEEEPVAAAVEPAAEIEQPEPMAEEEPVAAVAEIEPEPVAEEPMAEEEPLEEELPAVAAAELREQEEEVAREPAMAEAASAPQAAPAEREDAYIPPRPVEAPRPRRMEEPVARTPEPYAEAAMENGAAPQPASSGKLRDIKMFRTMVHAIESMAGSDRKAEPAPNREAPAAASRSAEPRVAAPRREPQLQRSEARQEPVAADSQPRLQGIEQQPAAPEADLEDDLFEIPTFLRRQAN